MGLALILFMCVCLYYSPSYLVQVDAPFIPKTKSAGDASNFDNYEEEPLKTSATEKFAKEFVDF